MLVSDDDLQLLATDPVWLRPEGIVLRHDLGIRWVKEMIVMVERDKKTSQFE